MTRHEEWHVTVSADPVRWHVACLDMCIKPLYIELNNFERQLMCVAPFNPCERIMQRGIPIIRVKHEVSELAPDETACYWECHLKFNGPFQPGLPWSSRDLYRPARWYVTHRQAHPFTEEVVTRIRERVSDRTTHPTLGWHTGPSEFASYEYEACTLDSNPELDGRWS